MTVEESDEGARARQPNHPVEVATLMLSGDPPAECWLDVGGVSVWKPRHGDNLWWVYDGEQLVECIDANQYRSAAKLIDHVQQAAIADYDWTEDATDTDHDRPSRGVQ